MKTPDEIRVGLPSRLQAVESSWESDHELRNAAVLAPILWREERLHLLYMLRRADLTHHAGEVSFPGGRQDEPESPLECALREFEEETGVDRARVEVLGALGPRTSLARYRVHPFVGLLAEVPDFIPQETEVEELLEIPIDELAEPSRWSQRDVASERGKRYSVPFFDFRGRTLWGLTARFTLDLIDRAGLRTRRN